MKYILTERQLNLLVETDKIKDIYQLMIDGASGPGTDPDDIIKAIDMLDTVHEFYSLDDMFKDNKTGYSSFQEMIVNEFDYTEDYFSNKDDFDKILQKLLDLGVKYNFGKNNTFDEFTISPPPPKKTNWDKLKNLLITQGFEGVKGLEGKDGGVSLKTKDLLYNFLPDGVVWASKGTEKAVRLRWDWENDKLKITGNIEPTKKASGYAKTKEELLSGNKILSIGSTGDLVKRLQLDLLIHRVKTNPGCNGLDCDGIFGQKTKEAVKEFQKKANIKVDGIVGRQTASFLMGI